MLGMLPDMGAAVGQFKDNIEGLSQLKDSLVVPHIARVLGNIDKIKKTSDVIHASNIVKQTQQEVKSVQLRSSELGVAFEKGKKADSPCIVGKISN